MDDRPSPDRCDSASGCYSWSPTTYPGGGGGRDSFGDVDFACGAREGVKRAVAQSILPRSEPPDERSRERRTLKRSVWVVSGRGDFLEYFHGHALGVCWSRTATRGTVVPPSQEGLDVLDAASWGGDGGFLLGLGTASLPSFADTYSSCRTGCLVPTCAWMFGPSPRHWLNRFVVCPSCGV